MFLTALRSWHKTHDPRIDDFVLPVNSPIPPVRGILQMFYDRTDDPDQLMTEIRDIITFGTGIGEDNKLHNGQVGTARYEKAKAAALEVLDAAYKTISTAKGKHFVSGEDNLKPKSALARLVSQFPENKGVKSLLSKGVLLEKDDYIYPRLKKFIVQVYGSKFYSLSSILGIVIYKKSRTATIMTDSDYCNNKNARHTNSTVYFRLEPNGMISQCCNSKREVERKGGIVCSHFRGT
jgi:hypothetical protein